MRYWVDQTRPGVYIGEKDGRFYEFPAKVNGWQEARPYAYDYQRPLIPIKKSFLMGTGAPGTTRVATYA